MITSEQTKLIYGLVIGAEEPRMTNDEFLAEWGARYGAEDGAHLGFRLLSCAMDERRADDVEWALIVCSVFGYCEAHIPLLLSLADADWHHSHEDVAWMLGIIGGAQAVPALVHLATWVPDYLEWDDARALGVKAVWSLYKIHSENARQALVVLVDDSNEVISKNARERLLNW